MSCQKCHKEGQLSRVEYGDQLKLLCDECVKSPGLGTCYMCKKIPKDRGNFMAEKNQRIYRFICSDILCLTIARTLAKKNNESQEGKMEMICSICGIKSKILFRCGKCHKKIYCSKKCQQKDWANHKFECLKK